MIKPSSALERHHVCSPHIGQKPQAISKTAGRHAIQNSEWGFPALGSIHIYLLHQDVKSLGRLEPSLVTPFLRGVERDEQDVIRGDAELQYRLNDGSYRMDVGHIYLRVCTGLNEKSHRVLPRHPDRLAVIEVPFVACTISEDPRFWMIEGKLACSQATLVEITID